MTDPQITPDVILPIVVQLTQGGNDYHHVSSNLLQAYNKICIVGMNGNKAKVGKL